MANEEEFMEHLTGNPIHAYRLMKRLCFDWETVEKEIKVDNWQGKSSVKFINTHLTFPLNLDAVSQLERVRLNERFPKEEDLFGATSALVRLQDTYELNMTELVRGNLWGRQTHAGIKYSSKL
jgi:prolyl 4-hydroxylase